MEILIHNATVMFKLVKLSHGPFEILYSSSLFARNVTRLDWIGLYQCPLQGGLSLLSNTTRYVLITIHS